MQKKGNGVPGRGRREEAGLRSYLDSGLSSEGSEQELQSRDGHAFLRGVTAPCSSRANLRGLLLPPEPSLGMTNKQDGSLRCGLAAGGSAVITGNGALAVGRF